MENLSNEIGRYVLCCSQALLKLDSDPEINAVRLGLGEYMLNIQQSDHLPVEKRIRLLREVLFSTDSDHLTKSQFFDNVLKLKSSDEARHMLSNVQNYIRRAQGNVPSTSAETEPTFEEDYPLTKRKKSEPPEQIWNFSNFLERFLNEIYESTDDDIEILEASPDKITYRHEDNSDEERDLIQDLETLLTLEGIQNIPVNVLLSLIEIVLKIINKKDLRSIDKEHLDNLRYLASQYERYNNHILFD